MRLRTIVERHAEAYGGNAELAKRIGITLSGLLRGMKSDRLALATLIRLADATGEPGALVLRLGGQAEIADVIQRVFGPSKAGGLTVGWVQERFAEADLMMQRMKEEFVRETTKPLQDIPASSPQAAAPTPATPKRRRPRAASR